MKAVKSNKNNPLQKLKSLMIEELDKVDELIFSLVESKVHLIPDISKHTISSGGKRLRPLLTLASANLCNYKGDAHVEMAACVEFMHTATLLHDDVVDKSKLRRGASTANSLWGNKESVLVGDYLLAKAFQLMGKAQSLEVYKVLSNAASVISEGEVMQLAHVGIDENHSEEKYFGVIKAKTAELFAAACEIGAIIADEPLEKRKALRDYGMSLGIAFQIVDDALDYSSSHEVMGKNVGDDFKERKITLPVIISYAKSDENERKFWDRTINDGIQHKDDLNQALSIIKAHNAIDESLKVAKSIANSAIGCVSIFPDSEVKATMIDILDFVVNRNS